jgi:hypothetical protein
MIEHWEDAVTLREEEEALALIEVTGRHLHLVCVNVKKRMISDEEEDVLAQY